VTFAEFRDRRRIFDIEQYSRQQFKSEVIPGLEPQQRPPRPQGDFGGRGRSDGHSRDRKFGGGGHRGGNGYANASGFNDRNARGPNAGFGGGRGNDGYGRKAGWGESAPRSHGNGGAAGAPRHDGFAPRGHAGAGKGFVPRDAQKRGFKPSR
jgi:hypothetical protein